MKLGFLPVFGLDGVFTARAGKLSCTAFRVRDGSLCLYSPVAGLEPLLQAQRGDLGEVSALLAPNHYHNRGLAGHVAAFPDATLYCSAVASPRLTKLTGLRFHPLEGLRETLTDAHTLLEPEGLKTGEVWVKVASGNERALIVADAFNSSIGPPSEWSEHVTMLGTFPRYGIGDLSTYRTWATKVLTATAPTMLLPCHGSPVRSKELVAQLIGRIEALR